MLATKVTRWHLALLDPNFETHGGESECEGVPVNSAHIKGLAKLMLRA
jgi:hypothetical protein